MCAASSPSKSRSSSSATSTSSRAEGRQAAGSLGQRRPVPAGDAGALPRPRPSRPRRCRACRDDEGGRYTFWDYQAGAFQKNDGIRIDHALLSAEAADRLQAVEIVKAVRALEKPSDHVPVIVTLAANPPSEWRNGRPEAGRPIIGVSASSSSASPPPSPRWGEVPRRADEGLFYAPSPKAVGPETAPHPALRATFSPQAGRREGEHAADA